MNDFDNSHYDGEERRRSMRLSDDEIRIIAEHAAEVALEKVYTQIGKSVVNKVLWLAGAAALAVAAWLNGSGSLKLPTGH